MSRQLILSLILPLATPAISGLAPADTTATSVDLQEIVVEAPRIIRKADMDVLYPSKSAVENSKNGMQLLQNLKIPSVFVNDAFDSITSAGNNVQVRINGREATIEQVRNLLPETIRRVEWIDNPGLRYNVAYAVLNFIVTNPETGGSLMTSAMPALNCAWGMYRGALKLNNGRSQWGLSANHKITNRLSGHRDYSETFTHPDGTSLTRRETPTGGYLNDTFSGLQIDYSYIKPDTTIFWIALHGYKRWSSGSEYDGRMSLSDGTPDILLRDYDDQNGFRPSMSAYLEHHFSPDRIIAVDLNTSLYNGRTYHSYLEEDALTAATITDVITSIRDRNQAYGIKADYIQKWKNSRLTTGVSYSANRNRSVYENMGGDIFHQRQDRIYFFGEYFHRIRKVTLTAGAGAQYTTFRFKETGQGNRSWNIRPQFTATYGYNQASQFRLSFSSWQSTPSLSETNIAPQQIDGFQWQIGNPDLKTSSSYMLSMRYSYTLPRVMGEFGVNGFTSPDAITPYLFWDSDRLITSYENSRGLSNISTWLSSQVEIIPRWLTLFGNVQYRAERMKGVNYRHYNHNWSYYVGAMLTHNGFTFSMKYNRAQKDLWGEQISWGESLSMVDLTYNWRKWAFSAGMIMPFGKYDQGSRSINRWNSNERRTRLDMRVPYIQISYNLQWGRQKRGAQKLVNAEADVQTSSTAGR